METSFEEFADGWDSHVGEEGHHTHRYTILPAVRKLIGQFKGMKFYDVACGNGFFARYANRRGAELVWASDISKRLIQIAHAKSAGGIIYTVRNASDFQGIPENQFDFVIAIEALPYIHDAKEFFSGVNRCLKLGGTFIFSISHPLTDVAARALGKKTDVIATAESYLRPGRKMVIQNQWGAHKDITYARYHRPLSFYINMCGKSGLYVDAMVEPETFTLHSQKPVMSTIPKYVIVRALKV